MLPELTQSQIKAFFKKNSKVWKNTGNAIKEMRLQLRISRKKLAEKAGISVGTLKKLENGKYIRRFKTVSKSCLNALEAIKNKDAVTFLEKSVKL